MRRLTFLLLFLTLAGCAGVTVKKFYKDTVYPATDPSSVVIHHRKPAEPKFIELGEVTVTGANNWAQIEKIFRQKSAEMGADAVYLLKQWEEIKEYAPAQNCYAYEEYYYPYQHFGWRSREPGRFYPRGSYYCYGYRSSVKNAIFLSAIGIAIKYTGNEKR